MNTTQPEVVMPRWCEVAENTLAQHRNLSQEKREGVAEGASAIGVHALRDVSLEHANWDKVDWESKKRFSPMGKEKWEFLRLKDETAGSTCRWCPDPHTDGYREFFPTRCNDCNTLNSYRYRGRQAALKLLAIKYSLDLESILWTFTFPLVSSNRPLQEKEIQKIAKDRRLYISQNLLRDKNIWHDKFVGINVMECEVTEPGETRNARFWKDDYERTSNMWTYHIHGHYLILSPKDSKVDLKLAYAKFGKEDDEMPPKMRLFYKHERDYDRRKLDSKGEVIGTRDEMKIMRDYLVGYARKDCLGKLAWNGDTTWRKVRTRMDETYLDENGNELEI